MKCTDCGKLVKPVVAIDIDGTIGDYHTHFFHFALDYLGLMYGEAQRLFQYDGSMRIADWMNWPDEVYRQVKLAYRQGGLKRTMPLMDGALALLRAVTTAGAEVWITTTRPYLRLDNVDPDTREWLSRNNIHYDGLIYDEHKYKTLIDIVGKERIVFVLDDQVDQFEEACQLGLPNVFLRETKYNRAATAQLQLFPYMGDPDLFVIAEVAVTYINEWKAEHGND